MYEIERTTDLLVREVAASAVMTHLRDKKISTRRGGGQCCGFLRGPVELVPGAVAGASSRIASVRVLLPAFSGSACTRKERPEAAIARSTSAPVADIVLFATRSDSVNKGSSRVEAIERVDGRAAMSMTRRIRVGRR